MAANLEIKGADFTSKVLESETPVLVDFWAPWCGPCRAIGPSVEQLAQEYAGKAGVYKVNVDDDGAIAAQYGVQSIPALIVFKGGKAVDRLVGAAPKPQIAALIDRSL